MRSRAPFGASAVAAGKFRRGLGLIFENEELGTEPIIVPALPLLQDIGPVLLDRVPGPFSRISVPCEKSMHGADPDQKATLGWPRLDLDQCNFNLFRNQPFDVVAVRFDFA